MKTVLSVIDDAIDKIQIIYDNINDEWKEFLSKLGEEDYIDKNGKLKVSLKDNLICNINMHDDNKLYNLILKYREFVLDKIFALTSMNLRARIKTTNSIQSKIETYTKNKSEKGQVPIIKCLNDIIGARIEIDDSISFEEIINHVKEKYPKVKVTNAVKPDQGYKAVHIYFKNGRYFFPLELQIWFFKDHITNTLSHVKYKQTYVVWEEENKTDEIIKKEED